MAGLNKTKDLELEENPRAVAALDWLIRPLCGAKHALASSLSLTDSAVVQVGEYGQADDAATRLLFDEGLHTYCGDALWIGAYGGHPDMASRD
jgi:hypothetical protein